MTSINVRFLDRAGNDIPGACFNYARQHGGDAVAEYRCALALAKQKLAPTGKRIFDITEHFDEIKLWVE